MCEVKQSTETKIDRLITSMDRLTAALERNYYITVSISSSDKNEIAGLVKKSIADELAKMVICQNRGAFA